MERLVVIRSTKWVRSFSPVKGKGLFYNVSVAMFEPVFGNTDCWGSGAS